MSVLEIIIYIALGVGVATYLTIGIIKLVKKRKKNNEDQRDAEDMPR